MGPASLIEKQRIPFPSLYDKMNCAMSLKIFPRGFNFADFYAEAATKFWKYAEYSLFFFLQVCYTNKSSETDEISRHGAGKTMSQYEKLLLAILSGTRDRNILFSDLRLVLERLNFQCRIKGDHFIYTKTGVDEIINIQSAGNMAKPYQVKQVRGVILKYQLGGGVHEI